jgi:hypothetical protein
MYAISLEKKKVRLPNLILMIPQIITSQIPSLSLNSQQSHLLSFSIL